MTFALSLVFVLLLGAPADGPPPAEKELFTPAERARLARAGSLDDRIRVYESASKRMREEIEKTVKKDAFGAIPAALETWASLLDRSLDDIRANTRPDRKKSKRLIRYEIQVRKAVDGMRDLKIKSPIELADAFDAFLLEAEDVRKEFIEILFLGR
ncbi:MAG: hypothetical protein JXP48_01645 [Acidobacteria bacterium]|nr:hypothetical protein [Acidobacteriota bacterium]